VGVGSTRREVVQRDDDILMTQQVKEHWPQVQEAMLKELLIWAKLKCWGRRGRYGSRNIMDVRWVIKFEWDQPTVDATASGSHQAEAKKVILARLTVRGFKDSDRHRIDRYAGSSSQMLTEDPCL
jgi:hypothetical protein